MLIGRFIHVSGVLYQILLLQGKEKSISCHSSSGDSTIRLWEDSIEDNGTNEIKAGSVLSHSILPTEQNDITSLEWSV